MIISFCRTFILLFFVILSVRVMGKRQIGQLQPSELVVTILLSQIAAIPMQDNDLPLLNSLTAVLVLTGTEIILSVIGMKSNGIRRILEGNPVVLINDGEVDIKQMKRLRYTIDDVNDALRQKNIFDISLVQYAIAETNGALSVMLKPENRPVTAGQAGIKTEDNGMPVTVISDGKINREGLDFLGIPVKKLRSKIRAEKLTADRIFFMSLDKQGNTTVIEKSENK